MEKIIKRDINTITDIIKNYDVHHDGTTVTIHVHDPYSCIYLKTLNGFSFKDLDLRLIESANFVRVIVYTLVSTEMKILKDRCDKNDTIWQLVSKGDL